MYPEMKELLDSSRWQPKAMDTHGIVNDPKGIEADFGYQKTAKGFDIATKQVPLAPQSGEGRKPE
jgi:hypothetical protein